MLVDIRLSLDEQVATVVQISKRANAQCIGWMQLSLEEGGASFLNLIQLQNLCRRQQRLNNTL
jgi:hypothetical protein